jgi:hypothetical protein
VKSLLRRKDRLCDIKKEIGSPEEADPYEQEQCAFFSREDEAVERVLAALRVALETKTAE